MAVGRLGKWRWWWALALGTGVIAAAVVLLRRNVPASELLARAEAALERGDSEEGARLLDQVLREDPAHSLALLYRGQLAWDAGELDAARAYFERVPDQPFREGGTARYGEGTILLERHRAREAERLLLRSTALHPSFLQPRERLAQLYAVQLRREDLRAQLEAIRELRPWGLEELLAHLIAGERIVSVAEGTELLETFFAADPEDVASGVALARYYRMADRHADAEAVLRRLRGSFPAEPRLQALLTDVFVDQGRLREAYDVLRSEPASGEHVWLWRARGGYALAIQDWESAAACFARAVELNPTDLEAHYRLGLALERLGRTGDADRVLQRAELLDRLYRQAQRATQGDPSRTDLLVEILIEVGDLLMELDRPHDAVAWFEEALARDPLSRSAERGLSRAQGRAARSGPVLTATGSAPAFEPEPPPERASTTDEASGGARILLEDVHERAGIDFQYFNGQTGFKYLLESMGGGVAVIDYDGDGWPDLYFPQGCELPVDLQDRTYTDRLYRNRGDGTFSDVTEQAGLGDAGYGQGCAVGDFDNDGDADLVLGNYGRNVFYRNNSDGTFSDISATLTPAESDGWQREQWTSSLAFADLDRDGDLDLYVCTYVDSLLVCRDETGRIVTCDPQNFSALQDVLYRNGGDGTLEDVTAESGIVAPDGKGLGVVVADLDNDGWPDIYVANDGTPNFLFENLAEGDGPAAELRFVERGLSSGAALSGEGNAQAGMGIACGDLNGDGLLELYVTNFYLEVNTLYLNRGRLFFTDVTRGAQLAAPTNPMLGFGTQAVDLDLDGRQELFVANGHIDDLSFRGEPWKMPPQLFYNAGNDDAGVPQFADVSHDGGEYFRGEYLGRGAARIDFDRDGLPDLVVAHQDRPAALLRNATGAVGNRIVLELRGVEANRDAIGARVRITAGGRTQTHEICGGDGFYCSNQRCLIVGLGAAEEVDRLEIDWPSGRRDAWAGLPAESRLFIIEGREPRIAPLAPARR